MTRTIRLQEARFSPSRGSAIALSSGLLKKACFRDSAYGAGRGRGSCRDNPSSGLSRPLWLSLVEQGIGQARGPVPTVLAALLVIPAAVNSERGWLFQLSLPGRVRPLRGFGEILKNTIKLDKFTGFFDK